MADGLLALKCWSLAYRYGNIPLARAAVERMDAEGMPTEGMVEQVEELWRGVPAAQTGWACAPDPQSEEGKP